MTDRENPKDNDDSTVDPKFELVEYIVKVSDTENAIMHLPRGLIEILRRSEV